MITAKNIKKKYNDQEVLEEIKSIRVMNLTPLQALQFIDQWQTRLKG